jgi:hypothetical protein
VTAELLALIAVVVVMMLLKFALDSFRSMARRTWSMAQSTIAAGKVVVMGFATLALIAGTLIARIHN